VIGLGTAGYISSSQLLSTTFGYSQNFITQNASISSLRFSTAIANNAYISTLTLDQLIFGDGNGWADFAVLRAVAVSTLQINTGILYATTVSTSQLVGVNFLAQSNLTSTVIGLGTAGYLSSVTAASLGNLVSTANLANLVSTANLSGHISTANLANFVSTTYLATQLGSTVIGLGTAGYLSTVLSSFFTVSTGILTASTITGNNASLNSLSTGFVTLSSVNFLDQATSAVGNVYQKNNLMYFNSLVFAGARTGVGQFLFPQ
jgi:hypothetical protein